MNAKKKSADFTRLKRKVFIQSLAMVFVAFLVISTLYTLVWRGKAGNFIVAVLTDVFQMEEFSANQVYQVVFRNNSPILWFAFIAVAFFILFYFFLTWFTRYFNEINNGINALLDEGEEKIKLVPELQATEEKLNTVHQTLRSRASELMLEEQRKNDLVMYLAHDIKTPLTSVVGYLSLLDESPELSEEQRAAYTHTALEKAYRLEHLVDEFFEITRYNLQQITLQVSQINLTYMFIQMTDELYPLLSEKGMQVDLQQADELLIEGDPDKLARVFLNILKNAVAYGFAESTIVIEMQQIDDFVLLTIQNSGETIPPEQAEAIFGKFYRLDKARSTNNGGAGLGLAIANEIIRLHSGTIEVQSAAQLTTFKIMLPLKQNLSLS